MQSCRKAARHLAGSVARNSSALQSSPSHFEKPLLTCTQSLLKSQDLLCTQGAPDEPILRRKRGSALSSFLLHAGSRSLLTLQPSLLQQQSLLGLSRTQQRGFLGVGDGEEESGVSRRHHEERIIGYPPEQLYDVVAAVDLYEDFVPWCRRSTVLRRTPTQMDAELEIGFRMFNERYVSHVVLDRPRLVKTTVSQSLLFDHLDNKWEFRPGPVPHSTALRFSVAFQFRSALYRGAANLFFDEVVARLVVAFEKRCQVVYGPSRMGGPAKQKPAPLHPAAHR